MNPPSAAPPASPPPAAAGASISKRKAVALVCIAVVSFLGLSAAQLSRFVVGGGEVMDAGNVAPRDIRAPRQVKYVSELETNRQRDLAAASVAPVFTPPDAQISRQQLGRFRELMGQIAAVRGDADSSEAQRVHQLAELPDLGLDEATALRILAIPDARWARVDAEVVALLDEVLRSPIRPDNLDSIKASLPSRISLSFTSDEAAVIAALAASMVVPNTSYDAAATDRARAAARDAVRLVERSFEANQTVVRGGQIISALDVEALDKLSIRRPDLTWPDVAAALLLSELAIILIGAAMLHGPDNILRKRAQLAGLSASIFVGAVFVARLMLPGHTWLPYLVPLGAVGIAITAWLGILPGAVSAVALAGLVSLPLDQPIEALLYWACSGVLGCLVMRRGERISDFFRAGLASGLAQIAVFLVFHPASPPAVDVVQIGTYIGVAAVSSLLSAALAPAILYVTGLLFDIVTPIQLIELSRPSHPLLQQMLTQAPGTYHHSLMVANMAEQAAERISADSLLTRVGAYYHDIGKSLHPYFFIENQSDGANVHNQLDPQTSSRVLQNHVYDGLELARRYRLPSRIRAFITEHHGSTKTNYQYVLASQANGQPVDDEPFRYPGPRPQSKETALVMLADGCEAAVRARKPDTVEQTDGVIRKVIGERLADHQLDDANLTLREIETIRQSFLDTLRGAYHPRIEYPPIPASQTAEALPEPHRPAAQA